MPEHYEELIDSLNLKLCQTQLEAAKLKSRINALIEENKRLKAMMEEKL